MYSPAHDSERPSYYAVLPAEVRYDKNLSPLEKLLFAEITALSNKEGYCWASNAYLAELFGRTAKYISEVISKLAKKNYLFVEVDQAAGNSRKIYIGVPKNTGSYPEKTGEAIPKKPEHNSITNIEVNTKTKYTEKDVEMTKLLMRLVAENFKFIDPSKHGAKDYEEMNRLNRRDNRGYDLIEFVIVWCQNDQFWRQNIRSVQKLRKQFDNLMVRAQAEIQKRESLVVAI